MARVGEATPTVFDAAHPAWAAYLAHLDRVRMAQHALHEGQPKPDTTYLGVTVEGAVIRHIAIRRQRLEVPPSALTGGAPLVLHDGVGRPLDEMFVQTFAVEDGHRWQGHGRRLQQAAIQQTRQQGCYQLRSWSSADAVANYALKLSLGFAVHPALYPMPGGAPLSGVYFVMVVPARALQYTIKNPCKSVSDVQ